MGDFDEWDDIVATGFEELADAATYTVAATGEKHDVGVIPIDEAETWQAKKGDLEISGTKVLARLYAEQMPEGWTGPDVTEDDLILHKGVTWRVKALRAELNRVWVVEFLATKRR